MQRVFSFLFSRAPLWLWGTLLLCSGSITCCSSSPSRGVKWVKPPSETLAVGATISLEWEVTGSSSDVFNHTNIHACLSGSNDSCVCVPAGVDAACANCCDVNNREKCDAAKCPRIDSQEQSGAPGVFKGTITIQQKGTWIFFGHVRINEKDYESDTVKVKIQ